MILRCSQAVRPSKGPRVDAGRPRNGDESLVETTHAGGRCTQDNGSRRPARLCKCTVLCREASAYIGNTASPHAQLGIYDRTSCKTSSAHQTSVCALCNHAACQHCWCCLWHIVTNLKDHQLPCHPLQLRYDLYSTCACANHCMPVVWCLPAISNWAWSSTHHQHHDYIALCAWGPYITKTIKPST